VFEEQKKNYKSNNKNNSHIISTFYFVYKTKGLNIFQYFKKIEA